MRCHVLVNALHFKNIFSPSGSECLIYLFFVCLALDVLCSLFSLKNNFQTNKEFSPHFKNTFMANIRLQFHDLDMGNLMFVCIWLARLLRCQPVRVYLAGKSYEWKPQKCNRAPCNVNSERAIRESLAHVFLETVVQVFMETLNFQMQC